MGINNRCNKIVYDYLSITGGLEMSMVCIKKLRYKNYVLKFKMDK